MTAPPARTGEPWMPNEEMIWAAVYAEDENENSVALSTLEALIRRAVHEAARLARIEELEGVERDACTCGLHYVSGGDVHEVHCELHARLCQLRSESAQAQAKEGGSDE